MTQFSIPNADPVATLTFSEVVTVDISAFTEVGDYISVSLPAFPRTQINISKTFIDFTSNESGDFGSGPTDHIAFDQASPALPVSAGDTEMRLPTSLLTTVDKAAITGVRFRIYATEECTFRCLSIRACARNWKYAPIDLDTLWDRVHRPPSVNGKASPTVSFPEAESKAWPIVFRSNALAGVTDPMPVDLSVSVGFQSGSFGKAKEGAFNEFAFYFRDLPEDNQTQVELNTLNQGALNTKGQIDFGKALYITRDQEDLDLQRQKETDGATQFILERLPDESEHSWIEVKLKWNATQANNVLTIKDADGVGYTFKNMSIAASNPAELDAGQYVMITDLVGSSIRVRIYKMTQVGEIEENSLVFDSGIIFDDNLIKRRRGRFGWWASLIDGDAYLHSIKTRGTNFGEIVSKEFQSITPVKGVSLYAGSTQDHELVTEVEPTSGEGIVTLDPVASATGKAYKISTTPLKPFQGIATNPFLIDDPNNIRISFDIKFPSVEIPGGGLSAFLIGAYEEIIAVNLSQFTKDTWSHVKVSLEDELFQTGSYRFILMQTLPVVTTTWWVENLSVKTYSVKWSARAHKSDAWNLEGDRWHEAGFTLNSLNGGIIFDEHGDGLQVRGQALRQDAMISDFKAVPQYATLGRFVFPDQISGSGTSPAAVTIEKSISERTVTFTGSATDADGQIVAYFWDFGDGINDSGQKLKHTYKNAGTYGVTLTAKDNFGNGTSAYATVTIT